MKTQKWIVLLLLLNLACVFMMGSRADSDVIDKISVREFELVDSKGIQRASLRVEPEGEVVFRLMDSKHTIRVKIGAGDDGSGLVLLDGNTDPGIHMTAKSSGSKVTVTGQDGKKKEY